LANKLHVHIQTIYYHIRKLNLPVRPGQGKRVAVTPAQAEMIENRIRIGRGPLSGTDHLVDKERAKKLIAALENGATKIQLVVEHDASLEESDAAYQWWQREKNGFVLPPRVVETLVASVGKFESAEELLLAIEEALVGARSCEQCGAKVKTIMCTTCAPKPGRPGPKPLPPVDTKPIAPDPIEEAKFKEIAKRLGLDDQSHPHEDPVE
jgi:hypothetical protein